MTHSAPSSHWDREFRRRREAGEDLDWGSQWTGPFVEVLGARSVGSVLDLGCGTGSDLHRLRSRGFSTLGLDFSLEALAQIRSGDSSARLLAADMSHPLPFGDASLRAIMSNVAVHMFDDATTRSLFGELRRVLSPGGVLLLHVNALEDRPLRARHHPPERELAADFVLEKDGQTMHFFSEDYLRELLVDWDAVDLHRVTIPHRDTGEPFKVVWRVIAS